MMNLESYTRIDENAKISGVALIPRISRNHNLYTKEELKRFDGITVPLNWEHNGDRVIGKATFRYNAETETVFYEGEITDPNAAILAKNRILYTSIEATPMSVKQVCNGDSDCFHMPYGLQPQGLALTETPGVPETSVSIIEKYIAECQHDHNEYEQYGASEIIHKTIEPRKEADPCWKGYKQVGMKTQDGKEVPNCVPESQAEAMKMCDHCNGTGYHGEQKCPKCNGTGMVEESINPDDNVDNVMQDVVKAKSKSLEEQIKYKKQALEIYKKMAEYSDDPLMQNQIAMLNDDIEQMTHELLLLRKDSEYISVESKLKDIVEELQNQFICSDCGELKKKALEVKEPFADYKSFDDCVSKNADKQDPEAYCATIMRKAEQVDLSGDHSRADIYKKKKKKKYFEFKECACEWVDVVKEQRYKAFTHSSSFVGNVRYDQDLQEMTVILNGKEYSFCNVPERKFDAWQGADSKGEYFNRNIKTQHDC